MVRLEGDNPPRRQVFEALQRLGIDVQVHYLPVYCQPYYQALGYPKGLCPVAEDYYQRTLSLPLFPAITMDDARRVVAGVREIVRRYKWILGENIG